MRNSSRGIVIKHLVERSERKKTRSRGFDFYLNQVKEREDELKRIEGFKVNQIRREEDGEWVDVRRNIRIFVRTGEDKEAKVQKYKDKLAAAESIGQIFPGKQNAKSFKDII